MDAELEVMRLIRVPPRGQLIVVTGNRRFEQISQVENSATRQLLIAAIGELIAFAGGYETLVEAGVAPPAVPAAETAPETAPEMDERQAAFLAALEREKDAIKAVATGPLRKQQLEEAEARRRLGDEEEVPELNIVEQINEILHRHLENEPKLKGRSLHLAQEPSGGLRIEVDGRVFDHPRDVDDVEVRRVIIKALREWEKT